MLLPILCINLVKREEAEKKRQEIIKSRREEMERKGQTEVANHNDKNDAKAEGMGRRDSA